MVQDPIYSFATRHNLTPRETDLLRVVAKYGYTNEQIAESLKIQSKTVSIHMTRLLSKTGCTSSRELLSKIILDLLPNEEVGAREDETRIMEQAHEQNVPVLPERLD